MNVEINFGLKLSFKPVSDRLAIHYNTIADDTFCLTFYIYIIIQ